MVMAALPVIEKAPGVRAAANMPDYLAERASFNWQAARGQLKGLPGGGLNMAYEALDRQVLAGLGAKLAVRFVHGDGSCEDLSYEALLQQANRCANALRGLGIGRGERVCALLGRGATLHVAALGSIKGGMVFCPLFSAFGPEPVHTRLALAEASTLITTDVLYERKVAALRPTLPLLRNVLLVRTREGPLPPLTVDFDQCCAQSAQGLRTPRRRTSRCCTSPAARPGNPRACCMHIWASWRSRPVRSRRWICARRTSTGVRPIPVG